VRPGITGLGGSGHAVGGARFVGVGGGRTAPPLGTLAALVLVGPFASLWALVPFVGLDGRRVPPFAWRARVTRIAGLTLARLGGAGAPTGFWVDGRAASPWPAWTADDGLDDLGLRRTCVP
jgi:hypothetical protein